jgi:hypothetical protein
MSDRRNIARRFDQLRSNLRSLEDAVLGEPENPVPEPEPEPDPRPEPEPDPPVRPRPDPEPTTGSARFQLDDLRAVDLTPDDPWSTIGGWLHVRAWFEPRGVTVYATNAYPGMGRRHIGRLRVTVDGKAALLVENKPLPPGYAYIASTIPASAEAWQVDDDRWFPEWSEGRVAGELASHTQRVLDHPVWWSDRNPGAPAGHGVAPGCGGEWEWLCGPAGKALRWQMILGELWTNVHRIDPATGEPLRVREAWWTGNTAANQLPGYQWTPATPDEQTLWSQGRMHDGYHRRRALGPCSALARWSEPARFLLRMLWNDVAMEWSMDPKRARDTNPLLMPMWQRIEESMPGKKYAVPAYDPWGHRGFAHAANTLNEVKPYIPAAEAAEYAEGFAALAVNIHDHHGICGRDASGDAGQWAAPPFNMKPPFAMTFHDQLVGDALERLGRVFGIVNATEIAKRKRAFLTQDVPPYGFESTPTSNRRENVWARKHTGTQGNFAYPGYGVFVNGAWIDADGWRSLDELDALARNDSLTGLPRYECVPPKLRPGGGVR